VRGEFETDRDRLLSAFARPPARAAATDARRAAVAAILSPGSDGPDLWFILRAVRAGDPWSGQIAFPGGRMDATDADPLHTAIRETAEELGLDLGRDDRVGALDDLGPLSGLPSLVVHPWVFWVPVLRDLAPSPAEVAAVFPVPLRRLEVGFGRSHFAFDWKGMAHTLPCVEVETPLGNARLWGMTLRIVDDLLHRLDGGGIGLDRACEAGILPLAERASRS